MFLFVGMKSTPSMYSVAGVARFESDWMTLRSIRLAYRVYARYTVSTPMITASSVFILPPPTSVGRRCRRSRRRLVFLSSKRLGNQRVDPREVRSHVACAVDAERGVAADPPEQRLEEPLDGRRIDEPDTDARAELLRQGMRPLRELVEFLLQILRKPGLQHFPLHLLPEPHDLPGHFAVLSVVVLSGDVGDDVDADGAVQGHRGHRPPSPDEPLTTGHGCENTTIGERPGPNFRGAMTMGNDRWLELDDEALERLLVERWLTRGVTLAVILIAAIAATWLGLRGVETL